MNVPHIPTNLPHEERARIADTLGVSLATIGLARLDDGTIVPAAPETRPAPVEESEPAPVVIFDPVEDAKKQAAFFDAQSAALAGGFASDAELAAAAEATHGGEAAPPAPSGLVAADGTTPLAEAEEKPPCSMHDLVQVATRLLAAQVGASYAEQSDATGVHLSGGLLSVDDAAVRIAFRAAAKLYSEAKKLTG